MRSDPSDTERKVETGDRKTATGPQPERRGRSLRLLQTVALNVAILLVPISVYYFAVIDRQLRYETSRAFRTLSELERQMRNELEKPKSFFGFLPQNFKQDPEFQAFLEKAFEGETSGGERWAFLEKWRSRLEKIEKRKLSLTYETVSESCLQDAECLKLFPLEPEQCPPTGNEGLCDDLRFAIDGKRYVRSNSSCDAECLGRLLEWRNPVESLAELGDLLAAPWRLRKQFSLADGVVIEPCGPAPTRQILGVFSEELAVQVLVPYCPSGGDQASVFAHARLDALLRGAERSTEFDEVLLATEDGTVLASVSSGQAQHLPSRQTHEEIRARSSILSLAPVFTREGLKGRLPLHDRQASEVGTEMAKEAAKKSLDGQLTLPATTEFTTVESIGGRRVRLFVRPMANGFICLKGHCDPRRSWSLLKEQEADSSSPGGQTSPGSNPRASSDTSGRVPEVRLVLVGVREESVLSSATERLSPIAKLNGILAVVALILSWPLLRLAFWPRQDSVGRIEVRGAVVAAILLTAVLAIAAACWVAHNSSRRWADLAAERYAGALAREVHKELKEQARSLRAFDSVFKASKQDPNGLDLAHRRSILGVENNETKVRLVHCCGLADGSSVADFNETGCPSRNGEVDPEGRPPKGGHFWGVRAGDATDSAPIEPQFLQVFRSDAAAFVDDPILAFFTCRPPTADRPNVAHRAYFQRHQQSLGWEGKPDTDERVTAQRLFNLIDGRKLLQVAIPRRTGSETFQGILSGDSFMHSLSNAVPLAFFRFAIFETATGTVLFHDDDHRSLLENLFEESEHHESLLEAVATERSGALSLSYHGRPHAGWYTPVGATPENGGTDVPWGVVVLYPNHAIGEIIAAAASISLVAYASAFAVVLLTLVVTALVFRRRFTWFWPQVRLAGAYLPIAWVLIGLFASFGLSLAAAEGPRLALVAFLLPWILTLLGYTLLARTPVDRERGRKWTWWLAFALQVVVLLAVALEAVRPARMPLYLLFAINLALQWRLWILIRSAEKAEGAEHALALPRPWSRQFWFRESRDEPSSQKRNGPTPPRNWRRWFVACQGLGLLILALLPATEIFDRALVWETEDSLHRSAERSAEAFELRAAAIAADYHLLRPRPADPAETSDSAEPGSETAAATEPQPQRYLKPWDVASRAGAPGFEDCARKEPAESKTCWRAESIAAPPWTRARTGLADAWWLQFSSSFHASDRSREHGKEQRDGLIRVTRRDPAGRVIEFEVPVDQQQFPLPWPLVEHALYLIISHSWAWKLVELMSLLAAITLAVLVLCRFLSRRLLWIDLTWPRRFRPERGEDFKPEEMLGVPRLILSRVRRWNQQRGEPGWEPIADKSVLKILRRRTAVRVDARDETAVAALVDPPESGLVIVEYLDEAVFPGSAHEDLLNALERVLRVPGVDLLVTCNTSPFFMLVRPDAYSFDPPTGSVEPPLASRWAAVFAQLTKHWIRPKEPEFEPGVDEAPAETLRAIHAETLVLWPRFLLLRKELKVLATAELKVPASAGLLEEDVVDYVLRHGEAEFRRKWSLLSRDERLMLYQLALNRLPNPAGAEVLEHLLERGLAHCGPEPRIASRALARFVQRAEAEGVLKKHAQTAASGGWRSLRGPFLLIILLGLAWLAYAASDTFNLLYALLVGVLGFAVNLLQAAGYIRGGGVPSANRP